MASSHPPSPTPVPTPTPVNAFITLDVTAGDPNTAITVNGGQFLPNEAITLYWDQANKVAGSATADNNGSFTTRIKPFAGDQPAVHQVCASVPPNPCATFTLQTTAATSPSPSPLPSESPSPSASAVPNASARPTPISTNLNAFEVISKPPFVFLPLIGFLAIAISLGYWVVTLMRRPRGIPYQSAAVVHRASRPDYTASFGTAPTSPATPAKDSSAWTEPVHPIAAPAEPHYLPAPAEVSPPVAAALPPRAEKAELPSPSLLEEEWRSFLPPADEPPELPEPGE